MSTDSTTQFWSQQRSNPGGLVSPTFTHYRVGDPCFSTVDYGFRPSPLGFSGAHWQLLHLPSPTDPNGAPLHTTYTNNLWHQGTIPEPLRHLFTPNFLILQTPNSYTASPTGLCGGDARDPIHISTLCQRLSWSVTVTDRLPDAPTLSDIDTFERNLAAELRGDLLNDATIPFARRFHPFWWPRSPRSKPDAPVYRGILLTDLTPSILPYISPDASTYCIAYYQVPSLLPAPV
jgi:hypothetical protein